MLAEPRRYIAQHRVELSTCPTWDPERGQLAPRRVDLRPFILTRPSGSWVLPGGLTRVALRRGLVRRQLQPGRRLEGHLGPEGRRAMISRVADHCFWFGRYVDRAESTARLLQATRTLVFDADIPVTQCWQPLVIVSGEYPRFLERHGADAAGNGEVGAELHDLGPGEPGQPAQQRPRGARRARASIRDVLSLEAWEEVNELYLWLGGDEAQRLYRENREQFYRQRAQVDPAGAGAGAQHDVARRAHELSVAGRACWSGWARPRASSTCTTTPCDGVERERPTRSSRWRCGCRCCAPARATRPSCKKYQGRVTAQAVVVVPAVRTAFPRSLRYCLRSAREDPAGHLAARGGREHRPALAGAARRAGRLAGWPRPAPSSRGACTRCSPTWSTRPPASASRLERRSWDRRPWRSPPRAKVQ